MLRPLAFAAAALLGADARAAPAPPTPLILVSIDGFRADYLARGRTPALARLARTGATGTMRPSFPSKTYPNHHSIVTGQRPDRHGIVDNVFEDAALGRFELANHEAVSDGRFWAAAEPLWITAERAGLPTALMFWPGGEARIAGLRPSHWAHYDAAVSNRARVEQVLAWLDTQPRPRLIALYFEDVDHVGHAAGPDSPEVNRAIAAIDREIARLVRGLARRHLAANLVVVSDHGMTPVRERRFLDDWTPASSVRVVSDGANAGVVPLTPAAEVALLAPHGDVTCRRKAELPPALHYGSNARIAPIVCIAAPGTQVTTRARQTARAAPYKGDHGYDPATPDMAALFIAHGPAFRAGVRTTPFSNVDVYPLLARLIGVTPAPGTDADPATLAPILAP